MINENTKQLRNRYHGALLGLAAGDALGTTLEFKPPGTFRPLTDMVGGGPFNLQPGQWTDDTSMALCLAESLVRTRGFDPKDQMDRYCRWWQEGHLSSTATCFDIGLTVSAALSKYTKTGDPFSGSVDPRSAGNGSLMRLEITYAFFLPGRRDIGKRSNDGGRAIEEHGVTPTVIATPEAAEGALPLAHSPCTVLKLHGDYLDTRLKNTVQELETYDEPIDALLDRVLDEYGLIVCGWSAQWDRALRAAFERRHSRRFSIYWVSRGEPAEEARRLIDLCQARLILSEGADSFFPDLAQKVRALRDLEASDPLAPALAAATVKRYLAEDRYRIRLNDFVGQAIREAAREFDAKNFALAEYFTEAEFLRRMKIYEAGTEVLRHMIVPLCHWGTTTSILELSSDGTVNQGPSTDMWRQLRLYPSLLLLYAGGVAALAADNHQMFAAVLTRPRYHDHNEQGPLLLECCIPRVFRADLKQFLPGYERHHTPGSNYLVDLLRPLMEVTFPLKNRYEECFDRFEYLVALAYADLRQKSSSQSTLSDFWGPIGRFGWRNRGRAGDMLQVVAEEISKFGENWAPLKAGLFDGSLDRLNTVKAGFDSVVMQVRLNYH
jgi:ADP-ribosylglycohydrolase